MSAWSFIGAGSRATAGGTLTSTLAAGTAQGDLILVFEREKNTANTVPAPTGYTALYSTDVYMKIFGKYAGASEPNPAGVFTNGYLMSATFRWAGGGSAPAIGSIIDSVGAKFANAVQINIPFTGLTPATDGCLVVGFGYDSGGAGPTASIADPSAFPNNIDTVVNINTSCGAICDYVIQTTAAAIVTGTWVVTNGGSGTVHGITLPLVAGTQPIVSAPAPYQMLRNVFVTDTIIQS